MFRYAFLCLVASASAIASDSNRIAPYDRVFEGLKPISSVTADIRASEGAVPERTLIPTNQPLPERYLGLTYCWAATGVAYEPLVFEEYNLERHGHTVGCLQPAVSGAHFLGSVATLPLTAAFCHDREYELGHIRPGSCAPFVVLFDGKKLGAAACTAAFLLIP
ncbi:MAG: hypothetical protein AB8G99_05725 [Planctomycetaceae bacterium]